MTGEAVVDFVGPISAMDFYATLMDGSSNAESGAYWVELNRKYAEVWPNITEMKEAPADAEEWAGKPNKLELLER